MPNAQCVVAQAVPSRAQTMTKCLINYFIRTLVRVLCAAGTACATIFAAETACATIFAAETACATIFAAGTACATM